MTTRTKTTTNLDLAVKQIGGRAVKVVQKAAGSGMWTIEAIERAAGWLATGSKEGGVQRPWPALAARLRTLIANTKKAEAKLAPTSGAADATATMEAPHAAPARARGTKAPKATVRPSEPQNAPTPAPLATSGISLPDLAERFLKHLEASGKSRGTVFSYSLDLNVATRHFGADRDATTITRDEVTAYFECDAVQKNRGGGSKNQITIAKLQRTLRLALVWAAGAGLIPEAPIPQKATSTEPKEDSVGAAPSTNEAPAAAKRGRKAKTNVNAPAALAPTAN